MYTLVGDAVTDIDGFYCALGEAINGPGGYFGWNLDALADCLCGGFGATWPFTLRWTRFEVADAHRAMAGDSGPDWVAVVLDLFQEQGIRVIRE
ncbi:barstar family protein [Nocardia sp. NPDC005978]|uniref:barstar family protein n=1 Tax=Nocardia sp. NPDC005978 TaxID=3156725 RepID=UPI0033A992DC